MTEIKSPEDELLTEVSSTATHIQNISPTKAVSKRTPYEAWYEKMPSADHVRIFAVMLML